MPSEAEIEAALAAVTSERGAFRNWLNGSHETHVILMRAALSAASAVRSEPVAFEQRERRTDETEWSGWYPSTREAWDEWQAGGRGGRDKWTFEVRALYTSPVQTREDGIREALKVVEDFTYSHAGAEDENTLVGMFARGSRNAKRKIATAILALLSQPKGDKT